MAILTIIGAGMMGSAMSVPARDNGHEVRLVGTPLDTPIIDALRRTSEHPKMRRKLPGHLQYFPIDEVRQALQGAALVINGVSSFGVDWFADAILPLLPEGLPVLSVTKGLLLGAGGTLRTFPQALAERAPAGSGLTFSAIGGPCTSYELADRHQTEVVFCGENPTLLAQMKTLLATDYYHIRLSTDVRGVEIAVGLKNAFALGVTLAAGMAEQAGGEGCAEHYNTQAALFGQSVREMGKLLSLLGGGEDNIVYGAGDLYVTIFGGRTRMLGTLLGRGVSFAQAMQKLDGVTLESVVISTRIAQAIRLMAEKGQAALSDFPLLMHVDAIINQNAAVNIPWDAFTANPLLN